VGRVSLSGGRKQAAGVFRWTITQSDCWRHVASAAPTGMSDWMSMVWIDGKTTNEYLCMKLASCAGYVGVIASAFKNSFSKRILVGLSTSQF